MLGELRAYWKIKRPPVWLFPGIHLHKPGCARMAQKAYAKAVVKAGICCPTCYKETYTERLFGIPLNDNNSLLRLLLLKVITQTIRRSIMRMAGPYYNPHRKAGLILLRRPAAPRSGFVDAYLKGVRERLRRGIYAGKLSEREAEAKFDAIKKEAYERAEAG